MDPLSIAASVVGLIQAISATCTTINTIAYLPKAFDHVKKHLPLVQKILEDVSVRLRQRSLAEEERQTIARIIKDCDVKARKLRQIFDALEIKRKQDKDARSWDKLRGWYHETLQGIKGHRVETLMKDILEDMRELGLYQTFRLATQEDIEEIKKALEENSDVEPSLDDAAVESTSLIYTTQNVNTGGMGQQNNPSGGTNTFNSGYNISGGTVHIGHERGFLYDLISHPPSSYSEFYTTKEKLYRPSYEWILSNDDFQYWLQSKTSQLLWIRGHPGKGKTMLLCGIIDTLQEKSKKGISNGWEPIYFFCQETNDQFNNATSAVRGLLESLFDRNKKLRDKYNRTDISYNLDINNLVTLRETFKQVLQDPDLPGVYLIVDALDECRHGLEDLLRIVVDLSKLSSARIKILVSSRDWPSIERELNPSGQKIVLQLELNSSSISDAVDRYIRHKVNELANKKEYDEDLRQAVQQHLKSNARDTFLWVALVCEALAGMQVRAGHTLRILEEKFPAGLESLYGRMIRDVDELREDAKLCKQILAIACIVYRPISWNELTSLLGKPGLQDAKSIIGSCGSFLTIQEEEKVISFIHQSAKDFLLDDEDALRQILPYGVDHQHYYVFSASLQALSTTLKRDMYELKDLGYPTNRVSPPEPDPLASVRYSCVYWPKHLLELAPPSPQTPLEPEGKAEMERFADMHTQNLPWYFELIQVMFKSLLTLCFFLYDLFSLNLRARELDESMKDGGIAHRFLKEKFLYWLEALSLLSSIPEGVKAMERLEVFSVSSTHQP
ncbi:unnamed protein product [Penicillium egyptiacum]|uniref:NACHT domain-containing protein n=1 Tax=Penicillium egyptiacum TaxID=1303716 RepID=A0A9W4P6S7_9EURO|nr:unnamed protein product [Penicillium egyptiacum]